MSILEILKYPDPFLKIKAKPVSRIDEETRKLISAMIETMYFARGIGLAATQVGADKRIAVLDVPAEQRAGGRGQGENLIVLINPEIIAHEGETKYEEGCLSVPGFTADVKRFATVVVKGLDKNGKGLEINAGGLLAIALQHEMDHLDGILFIDRLSKLKRDIIKRKIKKAIEDEKKQL
ncbi:MAG: peptide deformylase [Deltaproteobacteria bacterium]|nr:peptide deformylase [Deltaproteobacteria bacterium]